MRGLESASNARWWIRLGEGKCEGEGCAIASVFEFQIAAHLAGEAAGERQAKADARGGVGGGEGGFGEGSEELAGFAAGDSGAVIAELDGGAGAVGLDGQVQALVGGRGGVFPGVVDEIEEDLLDGT